MFLSPDVRVGRQLLTALIDGAVIKVWLGCPPFHLSAQIVSFSKTAFFSEY
jgi:hypothetical protein